jgi:hypothetical protein
MARYVILTIIVMMVLPFILTAQNQSVDFPFILSLKPKFQDEFIRLEELYKIDLDKHNIFNIRGIDADDDLNLYVLSYYDCTISVFDKDGKFINIITRKGQGPYELESPRCLSIYDFKIFVYENFKGIKEMGIKDKYSKYYPIKQGNYQIIRAYKDYFLTVQRISTETEEICELKKFDKNFENPFNIFTINYKSNPKVYFNVIPEIIVVQNSKNQLYFPSNFTEYKVNVFTTTGKLINSFGHEYKEIPYSEPLKKWFENKVSKIPDNERPKLSKYPPIVRYIMVDEKDYIWIIVGECTMDNSEDFVINTRVDIFNSNGEFLYTFQSPYIGPRSIIKNGRLYSSPTEEERYIHVFKIHYNDAVKN